MANSDGVVFPLGEDGKRSTMRTGQKIFAAAVRSVDGQLADEILQERKWRANYIGYIERLTIHALESAENALTIATNGLNAAHTQFQIETNGQTHTIAAAMSQPGKPFYTATVHGTAQPRTFSVPHEGQNLSGAALSAQLRDWETREHLEPDHKLALEAVMANPAWLTANRTYVLLGAGSEMGPLEALLSWGATVIAVDLDRPEIWRRLIKLARQSAGTLIFPVSKQFETAADDETIAQYAGANLISQAPEIAAWLKTIERPMVVGCYAYLDGGAHVQVSVAMDAISQAVLATKPETSLAYLLTPTDVYGVPMLTAQQSQARAGKHRVNNLANRMSANVMFRPNVRQVVQGRGYQYGLINSTITQQGPNYTLAKRLQRWRAIRARNAGTLTSCNVAPASYTRSVTKNRLFMIAYRGAGSFGLDAYEPETTKVLMAGMLIYDLNHAAFSAEMNNPHELFMRGANHGGSWRMPHQLSSMLYPAVIRGVLPW